MTKNEIGTVIVQASVVVHGELGPGSLETVRDIRKLDVPALADQPLRLGLPTLSPLSSLNAISSQIMP